MESPISGQRKPWDIHWIAAAVVGVFLLAGVGFYLLVSVVPVVYVDRVVRSEVSNARRDMRSLASAIESYMVECRVEPGDSVTTGTEPVERVESARKDNR